MKLSLLQNLGIALGLGLLVGMEREWAHKRIAGIRTFPLITIFGALAAALSGSFGGWLLVGALLAVAAMIGLGDLAELRGGQADSGATTEIAALVMFGVGAALVAGYTVEAVVVGGSVAVLLHWKRPLHAFVEAIGDADFQAITRIVLIALVIAPLLPNRGFGLHGQLNPFHIWLMVVLIEAISLGAWLSCKLFGARGGTLVAGLLGGLISSTATTVSYARRTREERESVAAATVVVLIASTVVFGRVLFEIAVVAPDVLGTMAPPLIVLMLWMAILAFGTWVRGRVRLPAALSESPPSELKTAILFGLLYALVLCGVAWAKSRFGRTGLYGVAALSGLTDMDAITLSTAQLVRAGKLGGDLGWRLIVVGGLANMVFKIGVVAALGNRRLFLRIAGLLGLALVGGGVLIAVWP